MLPLPPVADFLDLSYRADLSLLTLRWLRVVSFEELRMGFTLALAESEAHQATRWLVDARRRTELDGASSAWVAGELLPDAARLISPTVLRVAYLLSPALADELQSEATLRAAAATAQAPEQPYRLHIFLDEGPAVQWLQGAA